MNIENKKQIATLLLALGLGLVAVFLTSQYVSQNIQAETNRLAKEYEKKNQGLIQELEATKQEVRKVIAQQQALAQQQAALRASPPPAAAGAGQEGTSAGDVFSIRTPPGKRAYTILIDALSAVGGLITPGDFVDVIAHLDVPEDKNSKSSKKERVISVLFQKVQVLAVGTNYKSLSDVATYTAQQRSGSLNVTLALSPEEASLLTFAQSNGRLQLSLRSPMEQEGIQKMEVASWDALTNFVMKNQGTQLTNFKSKTSVEPVDSGESKSSDDEVKPFIQIFKSGKETSSQ